MNRLLFSALCALNILAAVPAYAEKADSEKPTDIAADQMTYDDIKQVNVFIGNVILTRGSLLMKAGRVVVTQDPAGYQSAVLYAAPGGLATFRQKRDGGPNLWVEGEGERIEYDGRAELVKLFTRAKLRRLEGSRPTDEIEGDYISYDSRVEFISVNNNAPGAKPGTGRIKAVIQPRIDPKAAPKPDANPETKAK
jgi:lipopolysaccharide export system protein LptA